MRVTKNGVLALALVALALMFYAVLFVKMGEIEERRHIKPSAPQLGEMDDGWFGIGTSPRS